MLMLRSFSFWYRLPLGLNTRYNLHDFESWDDKEEADEFIKVDRPVFKGVEKEVPASAISRVFNFAMIGSNLVGGAVSSVYKKGFKGNWSEHALNDSNIEVLANGLLKMRGAALKLGQFLSFQDETKVPSNLLKAMEKTRREAFIMPEVQLERILRKELGQNWRDKFDDFETMPFAAASIGQVHKAVYKGKKIAIKIQYPGVDLSIDSDLANLSRVIQWTNILPKGLHLDALVENIREDLVNECNYLLEAEHQKTFKGLLGHERGFYVADVIDELCTRHLLATEFLDSIFLDDLVKLASQKVRDSVATRILKITLKEIFEYRYMQTDPNPANFQYDQEKDQLQLLDFGATRAYSEDFINKYREIVSAGVFEDREKVLHWSYVLKFLAGQEEQEMVDAHVHSIFIVGQPFRTPGLYDFGKQDITDRVYDQLPIMMKHRMTPPPPETYTLHRKLSGAYLLCMKLKAKVPAYQLFRDIALKKSLT
jgi:aarF domain-containing kinase